MSEPLKFHPLADLFPLMEGADFDELVADIKAHGLREKIDLYKGQIVEGRNRYRALQRLGIDPSADPTKYFRKAIYPHTVGGDIAPHEQDNDARVRAYIISKNIHRRHLTAEQKRKLLVELVKASPEKSDRTLAKEAGTTHPTIAKARRQAEATGKALPVEKRAGADGKVRKQPARRPKDIIVQGAGKTMGEVHAGVMAGLEARKRNKPGFIVTDDDGNRIKAAAEQISRFAYKLIQLDIALARELSDILAAGRHLQLMLDLGTGIDIEESGSAPEVEEAPAIPPKRGRGRPPGSKNKKLKLPPAEVAAVPVENAEPADVSAETMKAQIAAIVEGGTA
jgi:hypothetical protein